MNNLTWETVTKMNAGIDLGLWNGSVNLVVDVFKEKRDDIFMQRKNVPGSAGFNLPFGPIMARSRIRDLMCL